MKITKYVNNF